MENIVNEIIRIDKEADERLIDADKESKKILNASEKEAQELKDDINSKAEKRIQEIIKFHQIETDSELEKINNDCVSKIQQLDEVYENIHLSIEDSIFHTIVGGNVD